MIPARRWKYSGGAIRLYGSSRPRRPRRSWRARRPRVGQVADQLLDPVAGQREVGLDDPRVLAALVVHGPGQAHHARALLARRVGDVGLAMLVDAEAVDQPQVRLLDRLGHFADRRIRPASAGSGSASLQ